MGRPPSSSFRNDLEEVTAAGGTREDALQDPHSRDDGLATILSARRRTPNFVGHHTAFADKGSAVVPGSPGGRGSHVCMHDSLWTTEISVSSVRELLSCSSDQRRTGTLGACETYVLGA